MGVVVSSGDLILLIRAAVSITLPIRCGGTLPYITATTIAIAKSMFYSNNLQIFISSISLSENNN